MEYYTTIKNNKAYVENSLRCIFNLSLSKKKKEKEEEKIFHSLDDQLRIYGVQKYCVWY